jgi:hypothetical protein
MVPAVVVKAGGAGVPSEEECNQIYAKFDPPIQTGTYRSVSESRREDVREQGDDSPFRNQQSEHFVPNSNLQTTRGDSSTNIPGADGYSEGGGFCYNVYDDQVQGTEHKWLTDVERDFSNELENGAPPRNATVDEWLDKMEDSTAQMLDDEELQRRPGEEGRSRIRDAENMSPEDRKKLAQAAAKCIRNEAQKQFARQGVALNTPLRNGQAGGAPPPPSAPMAGPQTSAAV